MEPNKLETLAQLRKQKETIETKIADLVAEITGIVKPKKRKKKTEALPTVKL